MATIGDNLHGRRGSGLIRTFVVASATLAILLVCFAMYQYTQVEPQPEQPLRPRLPSVRQALEGGDGLESAPGEGVAIGAGQVGPGREIKLTIYAPEGTRARFEIEVDDWTPKPGAVEEFILVRPRIRMRTRSGNAVRVTSDEGLIEAQRRVGGSLDPRRGRLTGNVVIEYDRLTETERAALPAEYRAVMDPRDLVRVEMNEIEFDLDYAKIVVPGRLSLTAVDAELIAADLSVNFNERENRVESLQIARGGRLMLRPTDASADEAVPGFSSGARREVSLVDWLRETIREGVSSTSDTDRAEGGSIGDTDVVTDEEAVAPAVAEAKGERVGDPVVTRRADGVFVFDEAEAVAEQREEQAVPYFARFEGDVDVSQRKGEATASRLQADWLEIWRQVTSGDTQRVDARTSQGETATDSNGAMSGRKTGAPGTTLPQNELVLSWSGRLGIKAIGEEDDANASGDRRTRVTAGGEPVRLGWAEGEALCQELVYLPDDAEVRFAGGEGEPARLYTVRDGSFTGRTLTMKRAGNEFFVEAVGPGQLERTSAWADSSSLGASSVGLPGSLKDDEIPKRQPNSREAEGSADKPQIIMFRDSLKAEGRFVDVRRPDFTNLTMREQQVRVIDRAEFRGGVRLVQDDVTVETVDLTVTFSSRVAWPGNVNQSIEHVHGAGDVVFAQGDDRLTCREIDIAMTTDESGAMRPTVANALGDVLAQQGTRSIRARDKLVMDMGSRRENVGAAAEPDGGRTVDRTSIALQRLRAYGEVAVNDPGQLLDVSAETLDCGFNGAGDIETAVVTGLEHRPASVRLEDFTVAGRRIDLNVPDEWAEVPGAGRLTLRSNKNLDGQRSSEPIPIIVTWTEHLRYQGRENRALFTGGVHATSQSGTTFDCDRLLVEFDDVPQEVKGSGLAGAGFWYELLGHVAEKLPPEVRESTGIRRSDRNGELENRFAKEPVYILATGSAVALTSEIDPDSGEVATRSRISGPKLSVNLREEVSKLLIEGAGTLLLEDYRSRPAESIRGVATTNAKNVVSQAGGLPGGLLSESDSGPSTTLIEWKHTMWYDFSIDQTRFEGDVELKHFSGAALQRIFNQVAAPSGSDAGALGGGNQSAGRRTFLRCDLLTVDFLDREARRKQGADQRMGQISAGALRQFDARGAVQLQDESEGLTLWASQVIYERPRQILVIHGSPQQRARIIKSEPGRLPTQLTVVRLNYDLATGKFQILDPGLTGQ